MRSSKLYNEFVTGDRVRQLHNLYMFDYSLGDQDWFSELGFSHPDLFHLLPCQFNRQTSIQVEKPKERMFLKGFFNHSTCNLPGRWNLTATTNVCPRKT